MELEIQKIIAENLPEQVGVVLRKKLERAENDAHDNIVLRESLEKKDKEITHLKNVVEDLRDKISKYVDLKQWSEELEKRQRDMDIEILKLKLEESEKRGLIGERFVEQIFRSPIYRKHVESITHGSYDAAGRYSTTHSTPVNETTSIE